MRDEIFRTESFGSLRQLDRINIQTDESSTRQDALQNLARMSAVAERAIHRDLTGLRVEHFENLRDHDRPVRPRRRLAGREHLRNGFGVASRVALFILLLKAARMFPRISGASL